jgi:membrane associated rhomboid family serine protease
MTDFRPGGFNTIPVVIKNLVIVNVLVYFAQITFARNPSFNLEDLFALHDVRSVYFKPHQLITYMFLHGGWAHLFFNMFALWMFGSILENLWGPKRFLMFYMLSGLGATILHLIILYFDLTPVWEQFHRLSYEQQQQLLPDPRFIPNGATVGASGAVFGCLAAFGYLFPNSLLYVYFLFPIKAKWFVLFYAGMELYLGIQNSAGDSVAHWAHLGGALVGFLLVWFWNKNNRRTFY